MRTIDELGIEQVWFSKLYHVMHGAGGTVHTCVHPCILPRKLSAVQDVTQNAIQLGAACDLMQSACWDNISDCCCLQVSLSTNNQHASDSEGP